MDVIITQNPSSGCTQIFNVFCVRYKNKCRHFNIFLIASLEQGISNINQENGLRCRS